jgi:hypothetical protein
MPARSKESVIQTERRVLQALHHGTPQEPVEEAARLTLKDYRWREPSHGVIFEILIGIPGGAPEVIREQLPARLTRKGFPDVDWENILKPQALSKNEVEQLMQELVESS